MFLDVQIKHCLARVKFDLRQDREGPVPKQRVEEWALTDPRLTLIDFIREIDLPVWGITPVAYRLDDGLAILVRAVVIFEVP